MKHIYYKNDFAVEITLLNASGDVVSPPEWQWHIEFTDGRRKYICSVDKGNANVVGNTIMCYLDNHKFCCGEIGYKFVQAIPDLNYLDGFQNLITPKALPIELWEQESDNDINIQSSVVPAYVVYDAYQTAKANGYTGTAEEFYDALNHIVDINKKEAERVEAEANRVTSEQQRVENFVAMESALTTATSKANTATITAEQSAERANTAADNADVATSNATQATTQATTATKRANDISADLEAKRESDYWRGAKGDRGNKGDKGDKGDRGEKGDQGERGLQGVQGVKGDDGVSPTVTTSKTGKVTTIEITDAQGTHTATVNDGESVEVVQSTGTSTTAVMSQKAVTDELSEMGGKVNELESEVIYDVTANNSGTTFDSLSALLSNENLSTLIPSEVRCGGMSIRFVQSSDNKYVQYRLMSDTFNTTPANWQGVDSEPKAFSTNLIESGAVSIIQEDLELLNKGITGLIAYIGSIDGTKLVNYGKAKYSVFKLKAGMSVLKAKKSASSISLLAVLKTFEYDPAKPYTLDYATGFSTRTELTSNSIVTINIPSDANYILISRSLSSGVDNTPSVFSIDGVDYAMTYDERLRFSSGKVKPLSLYKQNSTTFWLRAAVGKDIVKYKFVKLYKKWDFLSYVDSNGETQSATNIISTNIWDCSEMFINDIYVAQGNTNFIYKATHNKYHVGAGHGCEVAIMQRFNVDGSVIDIDNLKNETTINGDFISFEWKSEVYQLDESSTNNVPAYEKPVLDANGNKIVDAIHFFSGVLNIDGSMVFDNKLTIKRNTITFAQLHGAMLECKFPSLNRVMVNNSENSENTIALVDGSYVYTPVNNTTVNLGNGTVSANKVKMYSNGYNITEEMQQINPERWNKNRVMFNTYKGYDPRLKCYFMPFASDESEFAQGTIFEVKAKRRIEMRLKREEVNDAQE